MLRFVIDLDAPDSFSLDGVDRLPKMSLRLRNAGFNFAEIDDLWPAEIELEQPYTLDIQGSRVTYMQSSVQ